MISAAVRVMRGVLVLQDEDVGYFAFREINQTTVSLRLARSLEELVDTDNPQNVLKFRLACEFNDGEDVVTSEKCLLRTQTIRICT